MPNSDAKKVKIYRPRQLPSLPRPKFAPGFQRCRRAAYGRSKRWGGHSSKDTSHPTKLECSVGMIGIHGLVQFVGQVFSGDHTAQQNEYVLVAGLCFSHVRICLLD
jgi:hypothetical protein